MKSINSKFILIVFTISLFSLLSCSDDVSDGKEGKINLININKNLGDALKIMNSKKLGIVVVMQNNLIKGLISDGNLRREMKFYSKKTELTPEELQAVKDAKEKKLADGKSVNK